MDMKQPCSDYTLERWLAIFLGLLFLLPIFADGQETGTAASQPRLVRLDDVDTGPLLVESAVDWIRALRSTGGTEMLLALREALSDRIALGGDESELRTAALSARTPPRRTRPRQRTPPRQRRRIGSPRPRPGDCMPHNRIAPRQRRRIGSPRLQPGEQWPAQ
ncbi:MAG: hypothetical protein HYU52_15340 [Acidobacteria bacterium]|nr:hypothetical protein [Acidobacteriota bacterium]